MAACQSRAPEEHRPLLYHCPRSGRLTKEGYPAWHRSPIPRRQVRTPQFCPNTLHEPLPRRKSRCAPECGRIVPSRPLRWPRSVRLLCRGYPAWWVLRYPQPRPLGQAERWKEPDLRLAGMVAEDHPVTIANRRLIGRSPPVRVADASQPRREDSDSSIHLSCVLLFGASCSTVDCKPLSLNGRFGGSVRPVRSLRTGVALPPAERRGETGGYAPFRRRSIRRAAAAQRTTTTRPKAKAAASRPICRAGGLPSSGAAPEPATVPSAAGGFSPGALGSPSRASGSPGGYGLSFSGSGPNSTTSSAGFAASREQ